MRIALGLILWASAAGAQVVEQAAGPPAPPTPPPTLHRSLPPMQQKSGATVQALTQYSIGNPTDEEQYYLELINRARANPTAEGLRLAAATEAEILAAYAQYSVNLNTLKSEFAALSVRPPLAMNAQLTDAARGHSQDMFDLAFQGHDTHNINVNGNHLDDRATAAGYPWTNLGENVFSYAEYVYYGHVGFEVDWGPGPGGMQTGRGHRTNIHSGSFREVGVGVVNGTNTVGGSTVGPQLVTQDFGTSNAGTAFVTGVVYYDLNGNSFYDPGEGIGGLTVNVEGATYFAVTAASGGYAVPVPTSNATRAVTFSGLGVSGGGSAVISSGNNVKVDLTPVYAAPELSGAATVSTGAAATYNFTEVGGATGYEWRTAKAAAAGDDGAENLDRVSVVKTGAHAALSTAVKFAGASAYRMAHISPPEDQSITYNALFRVGGSATLNFRSRLALAGDGEVAKVQASTDNGATWADLYTQAGTDGAGEANFVARSIPLTAYADKEIRLRFVYGFSQGTYFPADTNGAATGWFVDSLSFANVTEITDAVTTAVADGETSFDFLAPQTGDFILSVRPVISGRSWAFGPVLDVTAIAGPPPPADIRIDQPAGTSLTDGVASVAYGTVNVGSPSVRTFTIKNTGSEPLTGLDVTIDGAASSDFSQGALGAATLNAGASTTFTVTFTPSAPGVRAAVLHVASNDADENPFDVDLSGTGLAEPDITVQQPADTGLTDGVSTVSYGKVLLGVPTVRTFKVINNGLLNLTGLAVTVEGVAAADYAAGNPAQMTLAPGQSTTFDVTFTPAVAGTRTALLRIASDDPDENPFDVNLTGTGDAQPVVSAPAPAAVIRQVGGAAVNFAVSAAPDPLTYQWKKNGAAKAGAAASSLTINAPKLTDAGAYTVTVKRGALSATSSAAQLAVVDNAPKVLNIAAGGSATISVSATGNGLAYQWRRRVGGIAEDLPADARLKGMATKTLSISKLNAATDSAEYFCEVTGPGGTVEGGATTLNVFDKAPIIVGFAPPDGIVGGTYSYKVMVDPSPDRTPTSFTATNLPVGLKLDAKTGMITGKPTLAKSFEMKVTASNSKGKTMPPASATVTIAGLPANLPGVYAGTVSRSPLNGNAGGRIDLTVSGTGSFTGSLTMGAAKYPLSGVLDVDVNGVVPPNKALQLKRTGKPAPAPLDLLLELDSNAFTGNSKVAADGDESAIVGWRQTFNTTNAPASAYLGYYTANFPLAGPEAQDVPQGAGYGAFTVAKNGKLSLAGKTADGETITCASFVGPAGQISVFQTLYTTAQKGSLLGQLQIGVGALAEDPADNPLSGALDWMRPLNATASARTYKTGFGSPGAIDLTVVGGRYLNTASSMILGLAPGTDSARLIFTEGGLAGSRRNPNAIFDVGLKNKITLPPPGAENEGSLKLTVTPANGLFTGTFTLDDPDPRKPPPAVPVILKRTVTYTGMMIQDGASQYGQGYFLLPQLPTLGPPPNTPTTTSILSGKAVLEPNP